MLDGSELEVAIVRTRRHRRGAARPRLHGVGVLVLSRPQIVALLELIDEQMHVPAELASAREVLERLVRPVAAEAVPVDGVPPPRRDVERAADWPLPPLRRSAPRHGGPTYTGTAECPECGRRVATLIPAGGDGSAAVYIRHDRPDGERCDGSRMLVDRD